MALYDNKDKTKEHEVERKGVSSLYGDLLDTAPPNTVVSQEPVKYNLLNTSLKFQPNQTVKRRKNEKSKASGVKSRKSIIIQPIDEPAKTFIPGEIFNNSNTLDITDEYWDGEYDSNEPNSFQMYINSKEHEMEKQDWENYISRVRENGINDENTHRGLDVDIIEEDINGEDDAEEDVTVEGAIGMDIIEEDIEEDIIVDTVERDIIEENSDKQKDKSNNSLENEGVEKNAQTKFRPAALLRKYGWKPGQGLGKSRFGISEPLQIRKSKYRPGLSYFSKQPANVLLSHVVFIKNESYDISDEMLPTKLGEQYDKFGSIESIKVDISGIYIKFLETQSAVKMARNIKNSRLYDEKLFDEGIYSG